MIKRLDHPALPPAIVITADQYEEDKKRGYCRLEAMPAKIQTVVNPRDRAQYVEAKIPAVNMFRCMECQFDVVDQDFSKGTGLDKMREHLAGGKHPWPYGHFDNPYGNIADVVIEGIDDYSTRVKENI